MRIIITIVIFLSFFPVCVKAEYMQGDQSDKEAITDNIEEDINSTTQELLQNLNMDEIDKIVEDMLGKGDLSFSELVEKLASGELVLDMELLAEIFKGLFIDGFLGQKQIILQLFLLILISALVMNLSHLFDNGQLSNVSFYMVYLMVFVLLMRSFGNLSGLVESVLGSASSFMEVLSPAYFLAITAANGSLTAAGYYQLVLFTISLVHRFLLQIAIPGIQMYVILGLVNYLSQEDFLSKMADLIKIVVVWMTKTVMAIVVGLQVIQKMVSPALDMVKRGVLGKTASAIPGIGNVLDSVTEMAVGCAVLVRNCMGAVTLIVLVALGLGPVIQIGVTTLLYRFVAAVVQPVSEKRLIRALSVMGEGCALLLRTLVTAEVLFLLTVAIVAAGGIE